MRAYAVLVLLLALVASGCGSEDTTPDTTTRVLVYLLRGADVGAAAREVPQTDAVAKATLEELLAGPSDREADAGLTTAVPAGTSLNDISIEDGIATVDLGGAFGDAESADEMLAAGLGQIVFTLTQFPEIEGVRFLTEGDPLTVFAGTGAAVERAQHRSDYEELSPAILVERPAVGDVVTSPLHVQGTANTFEATFEYEVLAPDGAKLAGTFVTATCGTGCRGTFDDEATFDRGEADAITLVAFERSAKDGSRINEVRIPLDLG